MLSSSARIAIVRLSALGDIVHSAVVLQFIRAHFPGATVEWIAEEAFVPLLRRARELDAVHAVPLKRIKKEKNLALLTQSVRTLRTLGPYDRIIDMQGLLKSAVVARLTGKNVHGFDAASAREGLAARLYATHSAIAYETPIVERNCALVADALHCRVDREALLHKAPLFRIGDKPSSLPERYIAVVVGASWATKRYPPARLAELCDRLPLPAVLVWGSEAEKRDAQTVADASKNARLAPPLSLEKLCDLVGHAALTLGGDTGPVHLAWALNRPSVVLFGPTTPRMMCQTPQNIAIESDSKVDLRRIDKTDESIGTISPERIAETVRELL